MKSSIVDSFLLSLLLGILTALYLVGFTELTVPLCLILGWMMLVVLFIPLQILFSKIESHQWKKGR